MKRKRLEYIIMITICLFIYLINHFLNFAKPADYPAGICYAKAKVVEILSEDMGADPDYPDIVIGKQNLKLVITSKNFKNKEIEVNNYIERTMQRYGNVGDTFIVASYDEFTTAMLIGYDRITHISLFLLIFFGLIVVLGKNKGLRSLFSLGFTMICVFFLLIPLILYGINPIIAAVIVQYYPQ